MGYMKHDTIIVEVYQYIVDGDEHIAAFRDSMPEEWRPLLVGPVRALRNGSTYWTFLPDGSKEYWDVSDQGDELREAFVAMLRNAGAAFTWIEWGEDHRADNGGNDSCRTTDWLDEL